jgi:hypothetical protein
MISRHLQSASSEKAMARGRPNAAKSEAEKKLVHDCRSRQAETNPPTIDNAGDVMNEIGAQVDKFWVYQFVKRHSDTLTMQTTRLLKNARDVVSEQDITK